MRSEEECEKGGNSKKGMIMEGKKGRGEGTQEKNTGMRKKGRERKQLMGRSG